MGDDQQTITVGASSDGPPLGDQSGQSVDLPVIELLTGRGFITGKSGSGKSNTASVVAEKLLDNGFGLLIVDIDGEYYGLKEEYEILHVGADEECDIQVTVDHAGKIASLALEQNVPIILDISSFLDEDEAAELLMEVAKQLFAKEKKQKQPFLLLIEECHEWIPQQGSMGEVGQMLIKIGKRGRKHGLGIVGISQRPADVKKDFITQCDWLVWHRLTWNNDTKVVSRILDSSYADAVENLDDGEAFLMTDWAESIRRVQFDRKQTFDAGATPGLEDVDRPDLKSVSSDLVDELEDISDRKQQTEDEIAELRAELDKKNSRIAELEAELQDARDLSRMADQFVDALSDTIRGQNPGRTEQERMRHERQLREGEIDPVQTNLSEALADTRAAPDESEGADETGTDTGDVAEIPIIDSEPDDTPSEDSTPSTPESDGDTSASDDLEPDDASLATADEESRADDASVAAAMAAVGDEDGMLLENATDRAPVSTYPGELPTDGEALVDDLRTTIGELDPRPRRMLRYYCREGAATPMDAHTASGGDDDRTTAYAHNRTLRTHGLIEHVGRGTYDDRLRDLVAAEYPGQATDDELDAMVEAIEATFLD